MVATARRLLTADDVLRMGEDAHVEVIEGELREMAAAGGRHGKVGGRFAVHLGNYGIREGIGDVYTSETGFVIKHSPLILLVPDVVFIKTESIPSGVEPVGYFETPPDVVVEVRSPSQSNHEFYQKVGLYLDFGVPLVLAADPVQKMIAAFTADGNTRIYRSGDVLDGGEVLPGFSVPVDEFFP